MYFLCCSMYFCVVLCTFCVVLCIFCVVLCIFVFFYVFFVLFYVFLCCSMYFCVVLCIVGFVSFSVLFVCICVLNYCHRVATQLQLTNISNVLIHMKLKPTDVTISILFIYCRISTCFGPTGPSSGEFTQLFTQSLVQCLYCSGRVLCMLCTCRDPAIYE